MRKNVGLAIAHLQVTFNNTIVNITDVQGNTLCWSSAGACGFKGSRKSTGHAAQVTITKVCEVARTMYGVKTMSVSVTGPGLQRDEALLCILRENFIVTEIRDSSPIAHNGCTPPKRRSV